MNTTRSYKNLIGASLLATSAAFLVAACGGGGSSSAGGGGSAPIIIGSIGAGAPALSVNTANQVTFTPAIGTPLNSTNSVSLTFPAAVNLATVVVNLAGSWNATNTVYTIPATTIAAASTVNVTVSATSAAGTAQYSGSASYNVYGGASPFYYVSTTGNDAGPGTSTQPFATINQAMASAVSGQAVLVAGGTYSVNSYGGTGITVPSGVSLYGGYSANFGARNTATYATTITDTAAAFSATGTLAHTDFATPTSGSCGTVIAGTPMAPITVTALTTVHPTIIDGFTINGSANNGAEDTAAVSLPATFYPGSLSLTNDTLNGGAGWAMSAGVYSVTTNYYLYNDTVSGGTSTALSIGLYNAGNSYTVLYSSISGGTGTGANIAAFNDDWTGIHPTIRNSVLSGGAGANSYGMFSVANCPSWTYPVLENNVISGGSGTTSSTGVVSNDWVWSDMFNNTIDGGSGNSSRGVVTQNFATSTVWNNAIGGGSGAASSVAVTDQTGGTADIEDDILFTQSNSGVRICVQDVDAMTFGTTEFIGNNDLAGCPSALFTYSGTGINYTNASTTISYATTTLDALGNVTANPGFASASDWHLTAGSPAVVQQGGLNLVGIFGQNIVEPTSDMDGKVRTPVLTLGPTNIGAAGISMGAYEQ